MSEQGFNNTVNLPPVASYKSVRSMLDVAMELLMPLIPKDEWSVCLALGGASQHQDAQRLLQYYRALQAVTEEPLYG